LPPPTFKHVVSLHQIARALGWSSPRVRSVDDLLKPTRLADGSRAYDMERALVFIQQIDAAEAFFAFREAQERVRLRSR
jgi:hypothetical protein